MSLKLKLILSISIIHLQRIVRRERFGGLLAELTRARALNCSERYFGESQSDEFRGALS